MTTPSNLPLSDVVDVIVQVSPLLPATPTFNQGLIIGTSNVIPSNGPGSGVRVRNYTAASQLLTDGFTNNSPEYLAAGLYFGQTPPPQTLWVGRQDLSAIHTSAVNAAGTGYAVNDQFTVTQGGANYGTFKVTSVNGGGGVTAYTPITQGTGYAVATNLPTTTTGAGSGLTIDISVIGETCLDATIACRFASPNWWAFACLAAVDADSIAVGEWAQSAVPQCMYMYTTNSSAVLNNTVGNVMATLKAGSYNRAFGIYSTTQGGTAPNNIFAAVAAMGVAMGLNTGLANSYFTMKFKVLVGIIYEPLTETQKTTIEGLNGNLYLNYANSYTWLEQGTVANGQFLDEVLNLDMLASDYQFSVIDALVSSPSIGQDNAGQTQLLGVVDQCNARAANRGFIAGGVWTGIQILNLLPGTSLPNGYLSQSQPYSVQSPSDRDARKGMPIYVSIIEAGAIHSILIGVTVQR